MKTLVLETTSPFQGLPELVAFNEGLFEREGLAIEWADLLRDLDRLQEATIAKDGKRITTRTAVAGQVGSVFQAAGIALPPNLHERAA